MTTLYDLNVAATPAITIQGSISFTDSITHSGFSGEQTKIVYTVPAGHFAIIQIFEAVCSATRSSVAVNSSSWVTIAGRYLASTSTGATGIPTVGFTSGIYVGPEQSIVIGVWRTGTGASSSASVSLSGVIFAQS